MMSASAHGLASACGNAQVSSLPAWFKFKAGQALNHEGPGKDYLTEQAFLVSKATSRSVATA
jgi:hypothetical protein